MQCVLCVDIKADLSAANNVHNFQNYIDKISALRNRECVNKNTANTLLSCEHREHKCGTINGDVVLRQAYFGVGKYLIEQAKLQLYKKHFSLFPGIMF